MLDKRITELFFEKSMGQHIQESSTLNVANIDKGRWKILGIQETLLFNGIPSILTLVFSYVMLWILSPVAGIINTFVILVYVAWMFFLNQRVAEVCTPIDADFRRLNRHRLERWEKVERVKTCGKEGEELEYTTGWFERIINSDRGFWIWFTGQCEYKAMFNVAGNSLSMAYGVWLVWSGAWPIGLLYTLFSWSSRVSDNIWQIGDIEHQLNWNMPAVRSAIKALSIVPDIKEKESAVAVSGGKASIAFENVCHAYPITEKSENGAESKPAMATLRNISFGIEPGERAALIGSSGAGKTTIARLLLRYMDPDKGSIRINGKDLRDIKQDSWMRLVGYIPQQAQIFDGTIRYNLTYGLPASEREKITDEALWDLMRLLQIDFGERLNKGLETLVGRSGIKLSGGQAQRLMIGAAVMKKPTFMLIDEATSNLDSSTEKAVQEGLAQILKGDIGALVVAHRLSTVRNLCNKFIVLRNSEEVKNGDPQIEAVAGSFDELYQISPTFRRLADDQGVII